MKIEQTGNHEVIAAIKLDGQSLNIARSAAALARQAGKDLRLVHVFEPVNIPADVRDREWFESYHGVAAGIYDERSFFFQPTNAENTQTPEVQISTLFNQAESDLTYLASQLSDSGVTIRTSVLVGKYPAAILELSAAGEGSLLVAGAEKKEPGIFQSRLKDTFRLMAGASLPVLIIPDSREPLQITPEKPLRILVADDLSESSWGAIQSLTRIIRIFKLPVDVMHIHVEPVNTAAMVLSPEYELEIWPGILIKDRLINDRHDFIKMRMRNRSRRLKREAINAGGVYHLELWHGNVAKELKRAVQVHDADISVFGKHHVVHAHPLAFGQMRYKKMIDLNSAILVSPEIGKELHA